MKPQRHLLNGRVSVVFLLLLLPLIFSACSTTRVTRPPEPTAQKDVRSPEEIYRQYLKKTAKMPELAPMAELEPTVADEPKMPYESKLFSLSTRNTPLQDILKAISQEAGLNLVFKKHVDIATPVSVDISNIPLTTALDLILSSCDYFYTIEGNILSVKATDTRFFKLNYPLVYNRPDSTVGGDMLGTTGGSGTASDISGEFSIDTETSDEDHLNVWKEIENALKPVKPYDKNEGFSADEEFGLLSELGRAVLNPVSGTIVVTDRKANLLHVEKFLERIEKSLRRKVVIEAKIIEVSLNDSHVFGIDWAALHTNDKGEHKFLFNSNLSSGSFPNVRGNMFQVGFLANAGDYTLTGFLDALSSQGTLNVLSSPRISVLNNQSALISLGDIIPYVDYKPYPIYNEESPRSIIGYDSVATVERAQEGVSLGITAQIDDEGVSTLHVVPVVVKEGISRILNIGGQLTSIPTFNIRTTDTIVTAPDGATVVIGGMIMEDVRDDNSKVPVLGSIPMVGKLFSNQDRSVTKKELVILLNTTVVER